MAHRDDLAIILVHYFTPELVKECGDALRRDLEASGLGGKVEWLLVDNGSRPGDRERFAGWGWRVLEPGINTGYAAGVVRGAAESTAPVMLLLNPDVMVRPGCVGALLSALRNGAEVAGPRFYWDRGCRILLPPNEARSRRWEWAAAGALSGEGEARSARRTWRRHAWRHWQAIDPFKTYALSGALLALRREAWERVGPFDVGYRLYFEETDWLERLRRQGGQSRLVPQAEAVHLYNQSGSQEERAGQWFDESRRRFFRRHYGTWFLPLLSGRQRLAARSSSSPPSQESPAEPPSLIQTEEGSTPPSLEIFGPEPCWIEISPRREGFPAAAERWQGPPGRWQLATDVWQGMAPGIYWLRLVTEEGEEGEPHPFRR